MKLYTDLAGRALTRGNHHFWHAIATQRTASLKDDLLESFASELDVRWIDCHRLPTSSTGDLDAASLGIGGHVTVLAYVEALLRVRNGRALLRQLRPECSTYLEDGGRILVVSTQPQADFPELEGSSVILDAAPIRLDPLSDEVVRGILANEPIGRTAKDRIVRSSRGLRGAFSRLVDMIATDEDGAGFAPSKSACDEVLLDLVSCSIAEFGDITIGAIVAAWDTCGREFPADHLDDRTLRLLANAGLARIDHASDQVTLFPGFNDSSARELITLAESRVLESTTWIEIATDLFYIERAIRRVVWARLRASGDPFASLGDRGIDGIEDSWHADYAFDVRPTALNPSAPLSYTYLSRVADLAAELAGERNLGSLASADFRAFKDAVLPVRNRIGHMRLPRPDDAAVVRRWRRKLEQVVKAGVS